MNKSLSEWRSVAPCLFVLSTGRVGTKTIAALIDLASTVLAYHEPHPLLYGLSQQAYLYGHLGPVHQTLVAAFTAMRQNQLSYSWNCEKGYVETSPQATFLAPIIEHSLPEVQYVHLARNPGDVIRSGMRRGWYNGHPNDSTRIFPRPDDALANAWPDFTPFQKNVWLWSETNRWIADFGEQFSSQRWLFLRSEEIFAGNMSAIERLFAFINQPIPSRKAIQHVLGQQLNAQHSGEFLVPTDWSKSMVAQFHDLAGDTALRLGYAI